MPTKTSSRNGLKKWAALLVLLAVPVIAGAQDSNNKKTSPPPQQRPATPPQQRSATPAQQRPVPPPRQSSATPTQRRPATQQQKPATPAQQKPVTTSQGPTPQRIDGNKLPVKPVTQIPPKLLSNKDSDHEIKNLNSGRQQMSGVNRNELPKGQVTVHSDGRRTIADHNGRQFQLRADGTVSKISLKDGRAATYRPDGSISSVHVNGMEIRHSVRGGRMIVAEHPDHTRLVSMGPHYGYVERPLTRNGHDYIQRTYSERGLTYARVYRTYVYNNVVYERYVPAHYYAPRFYGWAYYPWGTPVVYEWGWAAAPWYRYYGAYLAPYPAYSNPDLWLTDSVLAANLQRSYQQSLDAGALAGDSGLTQSGLATPISPEIKNELAQEVKQETSAENAEAVSASNPQQSPQSTPRPSVLDHQWKTFIVASNLETQTADGTPCELTAGDILQLDAPVLDGASTAPLHVTFSKPLDCQGGQKVTLSIQSLEDMHNQFHADYDAALQVLASDQGKHGLPPSPPPNPYSSDAPSDTRDSNVGTMLAQQEQQADQVEAQVQQDGFRK